jgi:uncharacterized protein YgbK (DUF1537 family)
MWTVVLDDDPTGTQGAAGVPVVLEYGRDQLRWAFDRSTLVYLLTNTRALAPEPAAEVIRSAVAAVRACAAEPHASVRFVSRGDSTLRGHFPLEVETIMDGYEKNWTGCLLVPAFPAAGRLTLDGVHVVRRDGVDTPAAETEFALDATFGYSQSRLIDWARERVPPHWEVAQITSATFDQGPTAVSRQLRSHDAFVVVCPSIRDENDLQILADAQWRAEQGGVRFIVQSGPAYPKYLSGQRAAQSPPVPVLGRRGLVIVGSHTSVSRRQLAHAAQAHGLALVELDVARVLSAERILEINRVVDAASAALIQGPVAVATSAETVTGATPAESLQISRHVATALTTVARAVLTHNPDFVVSKGGITSRDAAVVSMGWKAAWVEGAVGNGRLPVWRSSEAGDDRRLVVFAGNVGEDDLLTIALDELAGTPSMTRSA